MLLGYNTNGFAHHDLVDAIDVLAEIGYQSVAITLDHHSLNPYSPDFAEQLTRVAGCLRRHGMRSVIETGARFLLDARVKHEPTLLTADADRRQVRVGFLRHAIETAAALGSDCVSLWSGILRDDVPEDEATERLLASLAPVVEHAASMGVTLGFEPEPGMFIDTMERFRALSEKLNSPNFRLTLDVGHLHCQGESSIADQVSQWAEQIVNVHIEDMRAGVHEHLMFGEGEIDFGPILRAFHHSKHNGGLHVELSRHSHNAPAAAARAYEFLTEAARMI
ncbi:MAG: isomerase [Planctomycetaceae bacterium]|nr:isomerase [Planctomycetaceae bacterium]